MSLQSRSPRWAAATASTAVAAALLSAVPPVQAASTAAESVSARTVRPASAPTPFDCSPVFFQSAIRSDTDAYQNLYQYSPVTNRFTALGTNQANLGVQVLGYNTSDNYIYELVKTAVSGDPTHMNLMKIDRDGNYEFINTWTVPGSLNVGDFWASREGQRLVAGAENSAAWSLINVDDTTAGTRQSEDFPLTGAVFSAKDIVVRGDTGYGLHQRTLYILNLNTRVVSTKSVSFPNSIDDSAGAGFGSAFADSLGNLYFFGNSSSKMWLITADEVATATPDVTQVGSGPAYVDDSGTTLKLPNDGASCPNAPSPYKATIEQEISTATDDTATLTATVNPNNISTTATVCYGTSSQTSGGRLIGCTETAASANSPLTGTSGINLTPITLTGLIPRTTYYWQVVARSDWATTYGTVANFTTTAAPEATTSPASGITTSGATLNGLVNPGGRSTTVTFCYDTDPSLGTCTTVNATQSPLTASSDDTTVTAALTGLQPGTTYYARLSATNADGSDQGSIVSFTTSAVPLVSLGNASDVTSTDARLTATVNPKGLSTTVSFCWGTQPSLATCDDSAAASQSPLMPIDDSASVSVDLTGLTAATQYYMRVSASNANGATTSSIGTFTTAANPLTLTTTTGALPGANVGEPYSKTLSAGGGQQPYTWAVASGSLPVGLTLDDSGVISGTPTVDGATSFVVRVTDATNATATRTFSISTGAAPTAITTAVTAVAGTTATLNGKVDPGNLLTAADFCYGTNINLTGCTTIAASQSPLSASTSTSNVSVGLTGLALGTTYYARLTATNSDDSSTGSIVSFTTTNKPSVTTGAATFLRDSGTTATLSGTVNPNGAETAVSFCYGTTPTLDSCTSVSDDTLSASRTASAVSVNVSGLAPEGVYYFNVRATNSLGTTAGTTATFTMPTSSAPGPTISTVSPGDDTVGGGATVTVTGSNFATTGSMPTVFFGDAAGSVTARTATTLTVTAPAVTYPGTVDITVANPDGQASLKVNAFTYTSAVRYTVTYNGNGYSSGAVPIDATQYPYGATVTAEDTGTMARSGYDFDGWNTSADGTGSAYAAGDTFSIVSDDTLYAQWTPVVIDSLSDDSVNFGQHAVSAGTTEPQVVSVINSGAAPMSITGISVAGADPSDFVIDGGTCDSGGIVTGNSSCTIELAFAPSQVGARSASLQVTTSGGPLTGALSGTGTSPTPTPTPTPTNPPGAPRNVSAIAGDGAAIVTWEAPASSGSFAVSDYQVIASPGDAGCRVAEPERQCIVTGLQNGVAYTFRVRALNGAGWGDYSTPSEAVTPSPGPAPSILIIASRDPVNPRTVRVTGTALSLVGTRLTPRFRFPGDERYRSGAKRARVKSDGTFTWKRRSNRAMSVYFTGSAGIRSNTVRIARG